MTLRDLFFVNSPVSCYVRDNESTRTQTIDHLYNQFQTLRLEVCNVEGYEAFRTAIALAAGKSSTGKRRRSRSPSESFNSAGQLLSALENGLLRKRHKASISEPSLDSPTIYGAKNSSAKYPPESPMPRPVLVELAVAYWKRNPILVEVSLQVTESVRSGKDNTMVAKFHRYLLEALRSHRSALRVLEECTKFNNEDFVVTWNSVKHGTVDLGNNAHLLAFCGELDAGTSTLLRLRLLEPRPTSLVVSLQVAKPDALASGSKKCVFHPFASPSAGRTSPPPSLPLAGPEAQSVRASFELPASL